MARPVNLRLREMAGEEAMAESGQRAKRGRPLKCDGASHLKDLGLTSKQSERWQSVATVEENRHL